MEKKNKKKMRVINSTEISAINRRKVIVEPVFAHIKHLRGFRQFLLRGLEQVEAEWLLICLTHNLLKLFRASKPLPAT